MKFVDFDKLKIISEHYYNTKLFDLELDVVDRVLDIKTKLADAIEKDSTFKTPSAMTTLMQVDICAPAKGEEEEDEAFFTTVVNIVSSMLLESICIQPNTGRSRERRLDVPDKLRGISANMSLLKRCINLQTIFDRVNISINWYDSKEGDLIYTYNMI